MYRMPPLATGTHDDLLAARGVYTTLYQSRFLRSPLRNRVRSA